MLKESSAAAEFIRNNTSQLLRMSAIMKHEAESKNGDLSGAGQSQPRHSAESSASAVVPTTPPFAETIRFVAEMVFAMINAQPGHLVQPPTPGVAPEPVVVVEPVTARQVSDESAGSCEIRVGPIVKALSKLPSSILLGDGIPN